MHHFPLGRRPSHDRKDLKYLHAPQSRGPRHQHATDVEARPQIRAQPMRGKPHRLLYPDASVLCSIASYIKHRHPATAVETHTQVVPRVTQSILGPASRLGGSQYRTKPHLLKAVGPKPSRRSPVEAPGEPWPEATNPWHTPTGWPPHSRAA